MDSDSRFQNPVHIRNGSLEKPSPNPIESAGLKPSQQIILDRFRALVKAREEERGLFRGNDEEAVSLLSTDEIVRFYKIVLSELILNSKPIITDLTIIAGEQKAHAKGIANAICIRIIEVPADQKLPSLYLLDSIVKNIGEEYIRYFSVHLTEVFCEAYVQLHPKMHQAMHHLFRTWSAVFPSPVLRKIEEQLQFSPSVNGQSSGLNSLRVSESPRPMHGIHVNPKYLEARRQFGHSSANSVGAQNASPTSGANLATSASDAVKKSLSSASGITRSSSPFMTSNAGSLLSSLDEFSVDNSPSRGAVRSSPSHSGIEHGVRRVTGREEEVSDWRTRNWQGKSKHHLKTSTAQSYGNDAGLEGPRALIHAYGIDEREKNLIHERLTNDISGAHGFSPMGALRAWQNTEEEEFDWQEMTPSNPVASLSGHGTINKIMGGLPNVGPNDLNSHIYHPGISKQSLILPYKQHQSHLDDNQNGSLSENRSFLATGNLRPSISDPLNLQRTSQVSLSQPNVLVSQGVRQNLLLSATSSVPSHAIAPSLSIALGHGLSTGFSPPNLVPGVHPPLPIFDAPNIPFHMPGTPFLSRPRGPNPGTHSIPLIQNIGQVPPNPANAGPLSGLFSSLVAQGLISLTKQDSVGVEFDPDGLKERHESAIAALYGDLPRQCTSCGLRFKSQEEHSKHMDWHVNKNRTLKNRKTKPSPKWFVSVNLWLHGAEALGSDPVPGFLPAEKTLENEVEETAVPADENQTDCALCGERFDDFYSDEMEEWMYKGAVYMYAPAGSVMGMNRSQLGPIVHAKCKCDSQSLPSEDFTKVEEESAEEGNPRKKLRSLPL